MKWFLVFAVVFAVGNCGKKALLTRIFKFFLWPLCTNYRVSFCVGPTVR